MLLFVVPARAPEPHGLPVGVVGAAPRALRRAATRSRSTGTRTRRPPAAAIREREVYGAIVPAEGRVLVASAASPVVAVRASGSRRRRARPERRTCGGRGAGRVRATRAAPR